MASFSTRSLQDFRSDTQPIPTYITTVITLNIKIPESIKSRVEHFAREDGVSVDDYVATVLSQRVAVADADSSVQNRPACGSADQLINLLDKAPAVVPDPCDRIDPDIEQGDAPMPLPLTLHLHR